MSVAGDERAIVTLDDVLEQLQGELGDEFITSVRRDREVWVRVAPAAWMSVAAIARDRLGFEYFCFLSGLDWLPNPDLDGERVFDRSREPSPPQEIITDDTIRMTGGESRFQVFARLDNIVAKIGLFVVSDLADDLAVPSWTPIYRGADWHERETWEMFGFRFDGHPEMRHIYLPEGFEGHPLRKDFRLGAREVRPWPGLVDMEEMPKADEPAAPKGEVE